MRIVALITAGCLSWKIGAPGDDIVVERLFSLDHSRNSDSVKPIAVPEVVIRVPVQPWQHDCDRHRAEGTGGQRRHKGGRGDCEVVGEAQDGERRRRDDGDVRENHFVPDEVALPPEYEEEQFRQCQSRDDRKHMASSGSGWAPSLSQRHALALSTCELEPGVNTAMSGRPLPDWLPSFHAPTGLQ